MGKSCGWNDWKLIRTTAQPRKNCNIGNGLLVLPQERLNKLTVLAKFVSPSIFQFIEDCKEYNEAIQTLQALFVKPRNEIFARHVLATRRQQPTETRFLSIVFLDIKINLVTWVLHVTLRENSYRTLMLTK